MKYSLHILVCVLVSEMIYLSNANAVNSTLLSREKRSKAKILEALGEAGATLISSRPGYSETWKMPDGTVIDADSCWEDGSGPCPNGNCLDQEGGRGVLILEKQVSCLGYCLWRADCKKQFCCKKAGQTNNPGDYYYPEDYYRSRDYNYPDWA